MQGYTRQSNKVHRSFKETPQYPQKKAADDWPASDRRHTYEFLVHSLAGWWKMASHIHRTGKTKTGGKKITQMSDCLLYFKSMLMMDLRLGTLSLKQILPQQTSGLLQKLGMIKKCYNTITNSMISGDYIDYSICYQEKQKRNKEKKLLWNRVLGPVLWRDIIDIKLWSIWALAS